MLFSKQARWDWVQHQHSQISSDQRSQHGKWWWVDFDNNNNNNKNVCSNGYLALSCRLMQEYSIDCYLRQEWYDPRLKYSNSTWRHMGDITLHYTLIDKIWVPDTFFRNLIDGQIHLITTPNRLIRIFPDGKVLFSQRLNLRLECEMNLLKFPLDNQTCTINLGSCKPLKTNKQTNKK